MERLDAMSALASTRGGGLGITPGGSPIVPLGEASKGSSSSVRPGSLDVPMLRIQRSIQADHVRFTLSGRTEAAHLLELRRLIEGAGAPAYAHPGPRGGQAPRSRCRVVHRSRRISDVDHPQIWATPPSTKSSMPVTKLESLDARKSAAVAISSGWPMVPRGIMTTNVSFASLGRPSKIPVSMVPGLSTFTRILRAFRSTVHVRANDRTAALLAL